MVLVNSNKRRYLNIFLILFAMVSVVSYFLYFSKIFEHNKLVNEINSLKLSSDKPQIIGFENTPTDSEQIFSSTHPGVRLKLPIAQTTLGDEVNTLKSTLQSRQFTIDYNAQYSPDNIIGTSKKYFINIGIEHNGLSLPLVSTGQKSAFNGELIFAEPGLDTKVNSLQIFLEDVSKTGF